LKLDDLFKVVKEHTLDYYDQGQSLIPTFFGESTKKRLFIMGVPMLEDRENGGREHTLNYLRLFTVANDIKRYCLAHEAWVLMSNKNEEVDKHIGKIHKHPERVDGIIIMGRDYDQKKISLYRVNQKYTTDFKGGTSKLKEGQKELELYQEHQCPLGDTSLDGEFWDLLRPKLPITTQDMAMAQTGLEYMKKAGLLGEIHIK
jgi:hypothetical protein